jgi:hypothetical protein
VRKTCVRQRYNPQTMPSTQSITQIPHVQQNPPRTSPHHHPPSPKPSHNADTRHQKLRPLYTARPARAVWQCPSLAAGTTRRGLARPPTARPESAVHTRFAVHVGDMRMCRTHGAAQGAARGARSSVAVAPRHAVDWHLGGGGCAGNEGAGAAWCGKGEYTWVG